jgi:hypothetical protein
MDVKEQHNPLIMDLHKQILQEANKMHLLLADQVHQIQTYDPITNQIIISYIYKIDEQELTN